MDATEQKIRVKELRNVKNITAYKMIGGKHNSLASYNYAVRTHACHPHASEEITSPNKEENNDWSALYMQFKRGHVLGTLPYRWEQGSTTATLLAVTFQSLDTVVVLDGPLMYDSRVSGTEKASTIKNLLHFEESKTTLMEEFGERNMVAIIRETKDWEELIIPHQLLDKLQMVEERIVARFQKHATLPITHKWQLLGVGKQGEEQQEWKPWRDGDDDDYGALKNILDLGGTISMMNKE